MPVFEMKQTQNLEMKQEMRQFLRMEQSDLLEMPEDEFYRLIAEIEKSPLFRRLHQKEKLIRYQRSPGTGIASNFLEVKEEAIAAKGSLDVDSLLRNKELVLRQIKKLGEEKFKQYFLFPESGLTLAEIARECDLDITEVRQINSLIDEFSIMSEFYHPSDNTTGSIHYAKVARIEKGRGGFIIGYFSAALARGRYQIDYPMFAEMKAAGAFAEAELKEAAHLFKKLELINNRKDTLTQILGSIVDKQTLYLDSGNARSLLPLSQKELAKKIGVAPSSVSRAIGNKSLETPWGQEMPLKHFFPRPRKFRKEMLRQLLESDKELRSDEATRVRLNERFGVAISRRTVANLRQELRLPAAKGKNSLRVGI